MQPLNKPVAGLLLLLVQVALPAIASAYELQPSLASKLLRSPGHENMTAASFLCAMQPDWTPDTNCLTHPAIEPLLQDSDETLTHVFDTLTGSELTYFENVILGVRWPDDPDRRWASNVPVNALLVFEKCKSWLSGCYGPCANRLCLSHFGSMQAVHAMKPAFPWCGTGSKSKQCAATKVETALLIGETIDWLASVASGRIAPDTLVMKSGLPFPTRAFVGGEVCPFYDQRMVSDLFLTACHERHIGYTLLPWLWGTCPTTVYHDGLRDMVEAIAVGALLHLVQDSFANGHVIRIGDGGVRCDARVTCRGVSGFHDYTTQDSGAHADADGQPSWDESCLDERRTVDDPITAGARVLWMAAGLSAEEAPEMIRDYLAKRVFPSASVPDEQVDAARACFSKDADARDRARLQAQQQQFRQQQLQLQQQQQLDTQQQQQQQQQQQR